jgi:Uma2 family endonuclease
MRHMAVATLAPIEEYLSRTYHPDCEYADGRLIERNGGEYNHSFLRIIYQALKAQGLRTYVELRFQIRKGRFRVPDVIALARGQKRSGDFQTETPLIAVEILSPDDSPIEIEEKLVEYSSRQVPNIWVVDPAARTLTAHLPAGRRTYTDRVATADGEVSLDVADIFRQLAEDAAE